MFLERSAEQELLIAYTAGEFLLYANSMRYQMVFQVSFEVKRLRAFAAMMFSFVFVRSFM